MDAISHSQTSLLGIFYMYQENNAPFMTKNVSFAFFPWTLLEHSKKTLTLTEILFTGKKFHLNGSNGPKIFFKII